MSLGTPVTTACLGEMDETEQRVTKGTQVFNTWWRKLPFHVFLPSFYLIHSFIHHLCGHPLFTHSPTLQQALRTCPMPGSALGDGGQYKAERTPILMDFLV